MQTFFKVDPNLSELIDSVIEKTIMICILSGQGCTNDIQKVKNSLQKVIQSLQDTTSLSSTDLKNGVKQMLEQRLPDARIIEHIPGFFPMMDTLIDETLAQSNSPESDTPMPDQILYGDDDLSLVSVCMTSPSSARISPLPHAHSWISYPPNAPKPADPPAAANPDLCITNESLDPEKALTEEINSSIAAYEELLMADQTADQSTQEEDELIAGQAEPEEITAEMGMEKDAELIITPDSPIEGMDKIETIENTPLTEKTADIAEIKEAMAMEKTEPQVEPVIINKTVDIEKTIEGDRLAADEKIAIINQAAVVIDKIPDSGHQSSPIKIVSKNTAPALTWNTVAEKEKSVEKIISSVTESNDRKPRLERTSSMPPDGERLALVLKGLFKGSPIRWNMPLAGYTAFAQVDNLLVFLQQEEKNQDKILHTMQGQGWLLAFCQQEDLPFPRRLERIIRQSMRSPGGTKNSN